MHAALYLEDFEYEDTDREVSWRQNILGPNCYRYSLHIVLTWPEVGENT